MPCLLNYHRVEALGFFKFIFEKFARLHYRARQHRSGGKLHRFPWVISSYRLLSSSKRLFVCFYFDELPDQSRNSGVEALLLIKVIIKEISSVNSGEE
jgi:hypothetical protein